MGSKEISIQIASEFDAPRLAELAENTFRCAFTHLNDRDNIEKYVEQSFTEGQIKFEIRDSRSIFFIARIGDIWTGYAKLHQGTPPECVTPLPAVELARLYSMQAYLGCGIGSMLIEACIKYARRKGFQSIWLGSWKENSRANAFYTKMRFDIAGTTTFVLGSEIQEDYVFKKSLL
jgi:GNAT superfamily N-acetyltransferase